MRADEIRLLLAYNEWANERILDAAEKAGDSVYRALAAVSYGSLQGTLVHELGVEWLWRQRCEAGVSPAAGLKAKEFPTLASLHERWREEAAGWKAYLDGLSDADLERVVPYKTTEGTPGERLLWQLLLHVVNHGTQTRSEAGVVLSEWGFSPGDIDLVVFLRERG